jgi:hypothetical protein
MNRSRDDVRQGGEEDIAAISDRLRKLCRGSVPRIAHVLQYSHYLASAHDRLSRATQSRSINSAARKDVHCSASITQHHVFSAIVANRSRARAVARYNFVLVQRNLSKHDLVGRMGPNGGVGEGVIQQVTGCADN